MIDNRDGYSDLVQDAPEKLKDLAEEYKDSKGKETRKTMELSQEFKRALK